MRPLKASAPVSQIITGLPGDEFFSSFFKPSNEGSYQPKYSLIPIKSSEAVNRSSIANFSRLMRQAAETSRDGSSLCAVSARRAMKDRRLSVSAFSLPTPQIITLARLRSRLMSSLSWFSASLYVSGLSNSMAQ